MTKQEIYFSTDVETDGPIPGPNSMLSLGSAAFTASGELLGTFSANFELLPEAEPNPTTMQFWAKNQAAWQACRQDLQSPEVAMCKFVEWVESFEGKPVFVAFPAGFDFLFVYWYMIYFAGRSPFSFSALDGKTYAMALLKGGFREAVKSKYPRSWFPKGNKHTHVAVEDAIEQGRIFCNMLAQNVGG